MDGYGLSNRVFARRCISEGSFSAKSLFYGFEN